MVFIDMKLAIFQNQDINLNTIYYIGKIENIMVLGLALMGI